MNKKKVFQLVILPLLLFGGMILAQQKSAPVIQFSEAFENKLVGTIQTDFDLSQARQRQFFLVDQKGQIVWEFLQTQTEQNLQFSFDMPSTFGGGLYDFHIIWLDAYRQQILNAQVLVENIRRPQQTVFEATINRSGTVKVDWAGTTDTNAKLVFELRENSYWGPVIFRQETTAEPVKAGQSKSFETTFALPAMPESYLALAQIVDASGNPLSPKYEQRFLVLGDFAEIMGVLPPEETDLGNSTEFDFSGKVLVPNKEGLVLKIKESNGSFEEVLEIENQNTQESFSFQIKLPIPTSAEPEFTLEVEVQEEDGTVLESKKYRYKKIATAPTPTLPPQVPEPEFSLPWWIYAVGGIGLLAIVVLFWWMKRKGKFVV